MRNKPKISENKMEKRLEILKIERLACMAGKELEEVINELNMKRDKFKDAVSIKISVNEDEFNEDEDEVDDTGYLQIEAVYMETDEAFKKRIDAISEKKRLKQLKKLENKRLGYEQWLNRANKDVERAKNELAKGAMKLESLIEKQKIAEQTFNDLEKTLF
jgi:hypothetical protein